MTTINTSADLKLLISQLEVQQADELVALQQEWAEVKEQIKPLNLIRSTFRHMVAAPDLKTNILNAAIGLTTGIVTKKLFLGKTLNPLSKLLGVALEGFVASKATKNAEVIKAAGSSLFNKIFRRKPKVEPAP